MSKDLSGIRFGRLVALSGGGTSDSDGILKWMCRCDCGVMKAILRSSLASGKTKSCGCLRIETIKANMTKHGMTSTPEYHVWKGMKYRCYDKNCWNYKDWGGRGIRVCDRWRDSFENFYKDIGPRPSKNHTIERVDHNGNYEPRNCIWLMADQQSKNRRNSVRITLNGVTKVLAEWSRDHGIPDNTLRSRIRYGITDPEKLLAPVRFKSGPKLKNQTDRLVVKS